MKKYTLKNLLENPLSTNSWSNATLFQNLIKDLQNVEVIEEEEGYLLFKYSGTKMALLCNEEYKRMRVISPITQYSNLAPKIKDSLMEANFSTTLDTRYGVTEDTLYAAFMHPLISLTPEDLLSALKQVHNLAANFGKTYSSAQLAFTKKK